MKTPEQLELDRRLIIESMDVMREILPRTEFIVIGVEPDDAGGFHLKFVTSIDPKITLEVMRNAIKAAKKNFHLFKEQRVEKER